MQFNKDRTAAKAQAQLHRVLREFPWLWGIRQQWHHESVAVTVCTFYDTFQKPSKAAVTDEVHSLLKSRHDDSVEVWVMSITDKDSHHIIHVPANPEKARGSTCVKCLPWCGRFKYLIAVKKGVELTTIVIYRSCKKDPRLIGRLARCIDLCPQFPA